LWPLSQITAPRDGVAQFWLSFDPSLDKLATDI